MRTLRELAGSSFVLYAVCVTVLACVLYVVGLWARSIGL